jgi:DNA-binding CsgD family transcriptional regulator
VATIASRNSAGSAAIAAKTSRTSAATAGSAGAGARVQADRAPRVRRPPHRGVARRRPGLGHVGVAQDLQEVADVVIATHQAGARQDAGVGIVALECAHALLTASGATREVQRAARELDGLGRRVARSRRVATGRSWGALSPREREVADQVATGKTNREVAAALFLSETTIESHLTRIYEKLGLHSRSALAATVAQAAAPGGQGDSPASVARHSVAAEVGARDPHQHRRLDRRDILLLAGAVVLRRTATA